MMPIEWLFAAGEALPLEDVSTLNPASPSTESIRQLFIFVTAAGAFILAIVWGVLFYSLWRFRWRKSAKSYNEANALLEPPQVYGSMPIEIAWTVAPGLVVFLLTLVIVRTEFEVAVKPNRQPPNAKVLNVTVVGHQWWWEYIVDDDAGQRIGVTTANELVVPVSTVETPRPVYLSLQSADVCHSYWVPRLAGKTDLIPGRVNRMWFQTETPGLYLGQCAEYCGTQHANMLLRVRVVPETEFAAWLENEQQPAVENPAASEGKATFLSLSCVNCHTVRGTPAKGKFGPDLTHLASRETIAAGMVPLNRENLRRWIQDPDQIKPRCLMPDFKLSDEQLSLVTDYLMSLK